MTTFRDTRTCLVNEEPIIKENDFTPENWSTYIYKKIETIGNKKYKRLSKTHHPTRLLFLFY